MTAFAATVTVPGTRFGVAATSFHSSSSLSSSTSSSATSSLSCMTEQDFKPSQHSRQGKESTTGTSKRKEPFGEPSVGSAPSKPIKHHKITHEREYQRRYKSLTDPPITHGGKTSNDKDTVKRGVETRPDKGTGARVDAKGTANGNVDTDPPPTPTSGSESDGSMSPATTQQAAAPAPADTAEWQATIEKVVKSVVSIHFCQTHAFDMESAISSEATGFVVDAEKGYILTNRVWT